MSHYKLILIYGFAIFAMFFGSGNLVFPLQIGYTSGNHWFAGLMGLLLTGILLPFLGLFVIKLHKGDYHSFFGEAGKGARLILPLFTLSLLGAFGIVPRCITVAHGGMGYLFPNLSLSVFSLLFCVVTFFFCLKDHLMVKILGQWMSPILLLILGVLIGIGILNPPATSEITTVKTAFSTGFMTGYQTMDLFAAFFFSTLIFKSLQNLLPPTATDREVLIFAIKPSIIGSTLLALVYLGFVFLGAHYSHLIKGIPPESMLAAIATHIMGEGAALFIALAMIFSCLTTAVALNNIYARYICHTLKVDEQKFPLILFGTTLIAFVISLLDFKGIIAFLAPTLELSYPGIIALTIMSIVIKKRTTLKTWVFWSITLGMIIHSLQGFVF